MASGKWANTPVERGVQPGSGEGAVATAASGLATGYGVMHTASHLKSLHVPNAKHSCPAGDFPLNRGGVVLMRPPLGRLVLLTLLCCDLFPGIAPQAYSLWG